MSPRRRNFREFPFRAALSGRASLLRPVRRENTNTMDHSSPNQLLQVARRDGDLGPLLDYYRGYLKVIARLQIGVRLQGKADASDLVQETLLRVHTAFPNFQGTTEQEWLAWLRQVLANTLANFVRRYVHAQSRDVNLEQQLKHDIDETSMSIADIMVAKQPSPSEVAMQREHAVVLAALIEQLPEDYRQVVMLRHLQHLSFPEVAQRMDRSVDSVKKLWARALVQLRKLQAGQS